MSRSILLVVALTTVLPASMPPAVAARPDSAPWRPDFFILPFPGVPHEDLATPAVSPAPRLAPRDTTLPVLSRGGYQSVQVNLDAFGQNIPNDAANEPSLAVDPAYPHRLVIGWRQFDTINTNFRQAGWAYSTDAGRTWTFPGRLDAGNFRSDPVLAANADGTFYYYSLSHTNCDFCCEMFISEDGGVTWTDPIPAFGGDKQWFAVDRTGGIGHGNLYAIWSPLAQIWSGIFTRSTDGGLTYADPVTVPTFPFWGTITVGPDGAVYVAGWNGSGTSFYTLVRSSYVQDPTEPPLFELAVPVELGGSWVSNTGPNPGGLVGQVWVDTDHSGGLHHGNVYIMTCVVPYDGTDPADMMFARSTDGGQTFDPPVRVNDDAPGNGAWQWFPALSVAPNGRIDAIWADTRNGADLRVSELFYAYSDDGGQTFSANVPITPPFDSYVGWPAQNKLGDYYHMVSDNAGVNLAYAATFNGEQDVYFLRIGPRDCNLNGVPDEDDVAAGTSLDCNVNLVPDECEVDCNDNLVPDACDVDPADPDGNGETSADCDGNGQPDECQPGGTDDCNANGQSDLCDLFLGTSADCNSNGVPDECDLADGTSLDCNGNAIPDECDVAAGSAADCNSNGVPDVCDLADHPGLDCQPNGVIDACEPVAARDACASARHICPGGAYRAVTDYATIDGASSCGGSGAPDVWYRYQPTGGGLATISLCGSAYDTVLSVHSGCPGTVVNEIACSDDDCGIRSRVLFSATPGNDYYIRVSGRDGATGEAALTINGPPCAFNGDCNANGTADECEPDCNLNGIPDDCDIAAGTSADANANGYPDECEILADTNCDGLLTAGDIDPFVLAISDAAAYADAYPACPITNADTNGDGLVNSGDIDTFVDALVSR